MSKKAEYIYQEAKKCRIGKTWCSVKVPHCYEPKCESGHDCYWRNDKFVKCIKVDEVPKDHRRKLVSGRRVESQNKELRMTIASQCPAKWLFVDLETGDVWHHREGYKVGEHPFWRSANAKEIKELKALKVRK